MNSISVIGCGKVGICIGRGFERLGHRVVFFDISKKIIAHLLGQGYNATLDMKYAVSNSSITFICVPTPSQGSMDSSYVISAIKSIVAVLRNKYDYHLIVIKSTVLPTTSESTIVPLLAESGKKLGEELGLCFNPEFLTEITDTWTDDECYQRDFFSEDRIVIGEYDVKSGDILERLYQPLRKPIFRTDLKTAEMIKYAANCMLATKISFWNEIFLVCQKLGIDSKQVADIAALDPRIGKYGTVHGKAFGGKCLPKDVEAFVSFSRKYCTADLLTAVKQINDYMHDNYGVRE